jgi:hypothetical protein
MPININQPTKAKGKGHEKATGCNGQATFYRSALGCRSAASLQLLQLSHEAAKGEASNWANTDFGLIISI